MPLEPFDQRLAKVRNRFASTLEGKIKDNYDTLPRMATASADAIEPIAEAYRRLHAICAVGPTVGFHGTGKAARAAEAILLEAHLSRRALTGTEAASLKKALDAVWSAAQNELRFMQTRG
jgi:hypothetical protein